MSDNNLPEVWLRGPLPNVPALLQPVAHALLQAREEINELMKSFPEHLLWLKPAGGAASPGFHLQHLTGVLNRLFTYAEGRQLTSEQFRYLKSEGHAEFTDAVLQDLLRAFNQEVDKAIGQLTATNVNALTEARSVGRANLPSTVIGLYTHAAEHTMRHLGQLLVTVKVLTAARSNSESANLLK